MPATQPDSAQTCGLLDQVGRGDQQALERLLRHYRPRNAGAEGGLTLAGGGDELLDGAVHGLGQALGDLGHAIAKGLGDEVFDGVAVHLLGRALRDEEVAVGLVYIDASVCLLAEVVFQKFDEHDGSRNGWLRGQCRHPSPGPSG
jgi:hypothetical protein